MDRIGTAVVTGATSGIGAAICDELRAHGGRLLCTGRKPRPDGLDSRDRYLSGDLNDPAFVAELAHLAADEFGTVDVLVINHGLQFGARLVDTTLDQARDVLHSNLLSSFVVLKHLIPLMQRGGSIVCVSSRLGMVGVSGEVLYSAAKGGLIMLARGAAVELSPQGIRVNVVAPGLTATGTVEAAFERHADPAAYRRARETTIPLGRLATPGEVAQAVRFLASDSASFITGAVLPVDGGYTAA